MITPILGSSATAPSNSATNYTPICAAGTAGNATESNAWSVCPQSGVLRNFYVSVDVAPGVGKSWAVTVMLNGAASIITATISDANTSATDLVNSIPLAAGDTLSLRWVPSGTPTAAGGIKHAIEYVGVDAVMLSGGGSSALTTGTVYASIMANHAQGFSGTSANRQGMCACAGTLKNFYVKLLTAPGAGTSRTFTVRTNLTGSAITLTIADAATTGSDTTHTVAIAAGDTIDITETTSGATTSSVAAWGLAITPTTIDESPQIMGSSQTPSATVTNYAVPVGPFTWDATQTNRDALFPGNCTVRKLYAKVATDPTAGGSSLTFKVYNAASGTALTCAIAAGATTANDTTHSFYAAAGTTTSIECVPANTPTVSGTYIGFVTYIPSSNQFFSVM